MVYIVMIKLLLIDSGGFKSELKTERFYPYVRM